MGNVYASSQNRRFGNLPPLYPTDEKRGRCGDDGICNIEKLDNPGTMEDLHKKCKDVFPVNFEGARVIVTKGLGNNFQVSHTIYLSSETPPGYRFGATYVGTKWCGPNEIFPVLCGNIDPSGNLNANFLHQYGKRLKGRVNIQVQDDKYSFSQLTTDYRGDDYTASMTIANPDIINNSMVLVGQYLQSISSCVALGAELAYQRSPQMPGKHLALLTLGAQYTGEGYICCGNIGAAELHFSYYQQASEQLHIGVELETNLEESVATVGYQVDIPEADISFKGLMDSNGNVGAVLGKKFMPLPFTIAFSGLINHAMDNFKFGLGFFADG